MRLINFLQEYSKIWPYLSLGKTEEDIQSLSFSEFLSLYIELKMILEIGTKLPDRITSIYLTDQDLTLTAPNSEYPRILETLRKLTER